MRRFWVLTVNAGHGFSQLQAPPEWKSGTIVAAAERGVEYPTVKFCRPNIRHFQL